MSLLIAWPDDDPGSKLYQTSDPKQIADAFGRIGCRFERREVRQAKKVRAMFINEHTHGDDDEVRFVTRGAGAFYLHIAGNVHALLAEAGDLTGVPQATTHWFDAGAQPDFTAIRFFHNPQGWVGIPTGSQIHTLFPDFDWLRARAGEPAPA